MTDLRAAIFLAADRVEAAREQLCELDARTGDGDHGVTMTVGARGVRRQVAGVATEDPVALVRAAASGMAGAGGAIGPIYGRALLAVATELDASRSPGGGFGLQGGEVEIVARCAAAAVAAVRALGGAKPGDKTILDALVPTADALARASESSAPLPQALLAARDAARHGAEATADMVAIVGRAARFGERSRGSRDPGAASFAIVIDALVASALGETAAPVGPAESG